MTQQVIPDQAAVAAGAGPLKGPAVGPGHPSGEADPIPVPRARPTKGGQTKSGRTTSSGRRRRYRSTSGRMPTGTVSATTGRRSAASAARNERGTGQGHPLGPRGARRDHRKFITTTIHGYLFQDVHMLSLSSSSLNQLCFISVNRK